MIELLLKLRTIIESLKPQTIIISSFVICGVLIVFNSLVCYYANWHVSGEVEQYPYVTTAVLEFNEASHCFDNAILAAINQRQTSDAKFETIVNKNSRDAVVHLEKINSLQCSSKNRELARQMIVSIEKFTEMYSEQLKTEHGRKEELLERNRCFKEISEQVSALNEQIESLNKKSENANKQIAMLPLDYFSRLQHLSDQYVWAKNEEDRTEIYGQILNTKNKLLEEIMRLRPSAVTQELKGALNKFDSITLNDYTTVIEKLHKLIKNQNNIYANIDEVAKKFDTQSYENHTIFSEQLHEIEANNLSRYKVALRLIFATSVISIIFCVAVGFVIATKIIKTAKPSDFDPYSPAPPLPEPGTQKDLRPVADKLQEIVDMLRQ
ncbi:MAG: hypothetical protein LBU65_01505 [Planctomycetaceae bacterium]|nr:hypothetical protein [Planctomycetaceae bacterium]